MKSRALLLAILLLAAVGACSRDPGDPAFDNPFDPNGTAPGTGYGLVVEARGDSVVMTWDNLPDVQSYQVFWSDASSALEDMEQLTSAEAPVLPPANTPRVEYTHRSFTAERTNWYRIVGTTTFTGASGVPIEATMVASQPVAVDISVLVLPVGAITTTPTRFIELDLLTGVADSVEVSNQRDFGASTVFGVVPAQTERVAWELPPVDEDRTDLWVHFRTRTASSVGPADSLAIQARFDPRVRPVRGLRLDPASRSLVMVDTLLVFTLDDVAGQSLGRVVRERRVAGSDPPRYEFVEDLTPASVDDSVRVHWDPAVEPAVGGRVKAVLSCDFGFADSSSVDLVLPTAVGPAEIEIVGGEVTTSRDIRVRCTAPEAGYVLLSEQPDFSTGTWAAYTDTLDYQLEATLGFRFLFAAFSNPVLGETVVTSTPVTLVSPPAPARR